MAQGPRLRNVIDDTFAGLCGLFMSPANPRWISPPKPLGDGWAEATKDQWARELKFASRPDCLGAVPLVEIRPALVQVYLDQLAGLPGKQTAALAAFRQVEKWAFVRDMLRQPLTTGVRVSKPQGGHKPWTEEQVALAEKYARPDIARAITLGANTGQRISDLVRMGPTDIERDHGIDGINVIQEKTRRPVWVPILSPLAAAMETWERRPGPFLLRDRDGKPWVSKFLSLAWMWERDHNRNLEELKREGLVIHGLRGHACVRLRRAGATTLEIASMVGMSLQMVKRYCRLSSQRESAVAAFYRLEGTAAERKVVMVKQNHP